MTDPSTLKDKTDYFCMPSLGSDMEAGTLIEWVAQPGDQLNKGDVIAVVETQKGAIEIEVFHPGVVGEQLIQVGESAPVGEPMARFKRTDTQPSAVRPHQGQPLVGEAPSEGAQLAITDEDAIDNGQADQVKPPAEMKDTGLKQGLEPEQSISSLNTAPGSPMTKDSGGLDLDAMRQAIAAAMSRSKREIPHYYLSHDIDLTPASDWLAAYNAERAPDARLLMNALLIKAAALTLRNFPELNGFDREGRFKSSESIHIGTAIAIRGGGLVAPALHDADQQTLPELMVALRDLVARTRAGQLRRSELVDASIVVSSLGERGADRLFPIIQPPQVASIGFGTPRQGAWVVDGQLLIRTLITASIAGDHRHSDGHRGALFLHRLAECLQTPTDL